MPAGARDVALVVAAVGVLALPRSVVLVRNQHSLSDVRQPLPQRRRARPPSGRRAGTAGGDRRGRPVRASIARHTSMAPSTVRGTPRPKLVSNPVPWNTVVTAAASSLPSNDSRAKSSGSSAPGRGRRSFSSPSLWLSTSPGTHSSPAPSTSARTPGGCGSTAASSPPRTATRASSSTRSGQHRPDVAEHVIGRRGVQWPMRQAWFEQLLCSCSCHSFEDLVRRAVADDAPVTHQHHP